MKRKIGDEDANSSDQWPEIHPGRTLVYDPRDICVREPDDQLLTNKISIAIKGVRSFPLKRTIIQFWRLIKESAGERVLTCSGEPYALSPLNHALLKYRSACVTHYYGAHPGFHQDHPRTIHNAPPAYAAMDLFTEVVLDLSLYQETITHPNPLLDVALECGLTCFMMVPVFDTTRIVGVIEVSMTQPRDLVVIFNELNLHLRNLRLTVSPPPRLYLPLPSPSKPGDLKAAVSEIQTAFSVVVRAHPITLAQVWVPVEKTNKRSMTRTYLLKTCPSHPDGDDASFVELLYKNVSLLPLEFVQVLVRRALKTHKPHLCRNIGAKLTRGRGMLPLLSAVTKSFTSLVVCLRSSHTGEQDYAFEFFWPETLNHLALMEDVLSTLRDNLPTFKHASGDQIGGDELHVVDVDRCRITIFPEARDDDDDLSILAVYEGHYKLVYLPTSATFADVMDNIKREFEHELNPDGTYKLKYQVLPGKWYDLTNDKCLRSCVSAFQASENVDYIKFRVLAAEEE